MSWPRACQVWMGSEIAASRMRRNAFSDDGVSIKTRNALGRAVARLAAHPACCKGESRCGSAATSGADFGTARSMTDKLADMLDQLGFHAVFIAAIKGQQIGFKKPQAFDLQHACLRSGKAHGDLLLGVQLAFKVADIKDDPLVGPFGGAFLGQGAALQGGGQGLLLGGRWRCRIGVDRMGARQACRFADGSDSGRLRRLGSGVSAFRLLKGLPNPGPFGVQRTRNSAPLQEIVQMGHRLDQGEAMLAAGDLAFEQRHETLGSGVRGGQMAPATGSSALSWFSAIWISRNGRPVKGSLWPGSTR